MFNAGIKTKLHFTKLLRKQNFNALSAPQTKQNQLGMMMTTVIKKTMIRMLQTASKQKWNQKTMITASWPVSWRALSTNAQCWKHALVEQAWCTTFYVDFSWWLHQSPLVSHGCCLFVYLFVCLFLCTQKFYVPHATTQVYSTSEFVRRTFKYFIYNDSKNNRLIYRTSLYGFWIISDCHH